VGGERRTTCGGKENLMIYSNMIQWMAGGGQNLAVASASATSSTAFPSGTTAIRVVSNVDVYLEISRGTSASAGTSGFLPANCVEYLPAQESNSLSAITTGSSGTLNIKPCCG